MSEFAAALDQAFAARESGDARGAVDACRRVLASEPAQPEALHMLAMIALENDSTEDAEALLGKLNDAVPDNPLGPAGLGALRLHQNRPEDAIEPFEQALALAPAQPYLHSNLGLALLMHGDLDAADAHFVRALELDPGFVDAHYNLGRLRYDQRRYEEAGERYARVLELSPAMAEAHNNLGNVHSRLGRLDAALDCFGAALEADPRFVEARYNAAITKMEQGRLGDALSDLETVVREDADHVRAIASLGEVLEALDRADEGRARYLEALEQEVEPSLPPADRRGRHYALGRIHDRLGRYDSAFAHFEAANDLRLERARRTGGGYDPVAYQRLIDGIIAAFPPAADQPPAASDDATRLPVFVLGMPRSGTSLVEQILASHSEVHGAGELSDMLRLADRLAGGGDWAPAAATLDREQAAAHAADYLDGLRRIAPEARRVVNKLPINFLYLGLIRTLFPAAPVIHCRRDALDTCFSNYVESFAWGFSSSLDGLGHFFGLYEKLMAHWERVYPGTIHHLDYERLVAEQEDVSRDLIEYCGLEWESGSLAFHETERPVKTASRVQVRRPIYRDSVGRWRNYERYLEPLKAALGAARSTQ